MDIKKRYKLNFSYGVIKLSEVPTLKSKSTYTMKQLVTRII